MIRSWLRSTLVLMLCTAPAAPAWAGGSTGGGSSSGSGSDTGGSGSGSGSDTGGSDSGTTDGGSSSGMMCTECVDSNEMVTVVSPADGEVVNNTFEVRVTAPHTCSCDTCGCYESPPPSISVRANNMTQGTCNDGDRDCNTLDQTFTVTLDAGTYTIDALAQVEQAVQFSASIEVEVVGSLGDSTGEPLPPPPPPLPPDPPATGGSSSSSGGTSGGASDGGGGGGCGCTSGGSGAPAGVLALLVLGAIRRRRS